MLNSRPPRPTSTLGFLDAAAATECIFACTIGTSSYSTTSARAICHLFVPRNRSRYSCFDPFAPIDPGQGFRHICRDLSVSIRPRKVANLTSICGQT